MNDSTPHDPDYDAPIEARIVSWVLGEASAFEAAELERLCSERPELLVFCRRIRSLHDLLIEVQSTRRDISWKLPEEKRKILDKIVGVEKATCVPPQKEAGVRHNASRTLREVR